MEQMNIMREYRSDLEREGPRSSKRNAVSLSSRIPTPREVSVEEEEEEKTVTSHSPSAVQTLVDVPAQEDVKFRPSFRNVVLPREPDVHPTAFGWT
jgi:hypothetical protein